MRLSKTIDQSMTVRQLIEYLEDFDDDAVVVYQYPSRDYWGTVLASPIEQVSEEKVEWNEYHNSLSHVDNQEECEDKEVAKVVMLF